jgi:uncharacterized protein (DUF433 family)
VPRNVISEREKARRIPDIEFKETGAGRVACVAGMKVWQLIQTWREGGEELSELHEAHPHLTKDHIQTAFAYYRAFPDEIDELIALNESFDIEEFWRRYPFTRPPWRAPTESDIGAGSAGTAAVSSGLAHDADEGRVLVTRDYHSYGRLTVEFFAKGQPHAGLVFLSPGLCRQGAAATVQAIAEWSAQHETMPPYAVEWLEALPDQQVAAADGGAHG